jgi:hypothetical protein
MPPIEWEQVKDQYGFVDFGAVYKLCLDAGFLSCASYAVIVFMETLDDLEQLAQDWPRIKKEIALLKQQNTDLKEALIQVAILSRTLYMVLAKNRLSNECYDLDIRIIKLLDDLHRRLDIPKP